MIREDPAITQPLSPPAKSQQVSVAVHKGRNSKPSTVSKRQNQMQGRWFHENPNTPCYSKRMIEVEDIVIDHEYFHVTYMWDMTGISYGTVKLLKKMAITITNHTAISLAQTSCIHQLNQKGEDREEEKAWGRLLCCMSMDQYLSTISYMSMKTWHTNTCLYFSWQC